MSNLKPWVTKFFTKLILSKTAKNTYILSFADISMAILAAITTAIIARNLSPGEFGTFLALWTFLTLISALLDLGIGAGIIAFVADSKSLVEKNKHIGPALFFLFLIGLTQFVLIYVGANLVQNILFPGIKLQLIKLVSLGSWFLIMGRFVNDALRAKQEFLKSGLATGLFAMMRLIFIIGLIINRSLSLYSSILIMALSPFVYFIIGYYLLNLPLQYLKWDRQVIRRVMGFSSWLGVNQMVSTISSRVDVLLLNRLAGALSAGIYGTAALMARIFVIITASMAAVFAPRLIELQEKHQRQKFLLKICLVIFVGWLSIILVGLIAKPLITIIFGTKYLSALTPFYLLLIAMASLMVTVPVTLPVIYVLKKPQIIAYLSVVQLIIVSVGNFILIPRYGILAPPILLIITQLIVIIVGGYYTIRWLKSQLNK